MSSDLNGVLTETVKIINFIKYNTLNSRLFLILCEEMGSVYFISLIHAEDRWLSRGRVMVRFIELRKEIELFLIQKKSNYILIMQNAELIAKCTYLFDIFNIINILYLSVQGSLTTIFTIYNKVNAIKKKNNTVVLQLKETMKSLNLFHYF